jgi:hypothetical protein
MISSQVKKVTKFSDAKEIIVAGIGAPLFAQELNGTDLASEIGSAADALPAFAVRAVAKTRNIFGGESR